MCLLVLNISGSLVKPGQLSVYLCFLSPCYGYSHFSRQQLFHVIVRVIMACWLQFPAHANSLSSQMQSWVFAWTAGESPPQTSSTLSHHKNRTQWNRNQRHFRTALSVLGFKRSRHTVNSFVSPWRDPMLMSQWVCHLLWSHCRSNMLFCCVFLTHSRRHWPGNSYRLTANNRLARLFLAPYVLRLRPMRKTRTGQLLHYDPPPCSNS